MLFKNYLQKTPVLLWYVLGGTVLPLSTPTAPSEITILSEDQAEKQAQQPKKIRRIIIVGATSVSPQTLKSKIPFREGSLFKEKKVRQALDTLYKEGHFSRITIQTDNINDTLLDLYIMLEEGKRLESLTITGNSQVKTADIEQATHCATWKIIDDERIDVLAQHIKKQYGIKGYRHVEVTPSVTHTDDTHCNVEIKVKEGRASNVKRVFFKGNECVPNKVLRALLFTREDWLFAFFDKAGTFNEQAIEGDRYLIENFYQSNGFLTARVSDIKVEENPVSHDIEVTFTIDEGELYVIESIKAPGNDLLTEQEILRRLPLLPGELYSRERIRKTLEAMRYIWGEFGYIFAEINPLIIPDKERKTVSITLETVLGPSVRLNRIGISNNTKTCDFVIRRQIPINEGELLTTRKMDEARERVEALGFFDKRQGVNWRPVRIDESHTDLELMVNEAKTGNINLSMGFGGNDPGQASGTGPQDSPSQALRITGSLSDTNLLGRGLQYSLNGSYSRGDYSVTASLFDPWLFGYPIGGGLNVYHRKVRYEDFKNAADTIPLETTTGGGSALNFMVASLDYTNFVFGLGYDHIKFNNVNFRAGAGLDATQEEFQATLNRRFQSGDFIWFNSVIEQDRRNHPMQPSRGYHWTVITRLGMTPGQRTDPCTGRNATFGFFKFEADARWYTPLINEYDLIFHAHGHVGIISSIADRLIPYRELFHIGGPATVRGFTFGQIGPTLFGDSLGATKAFYVNFELLFPIRPDNSIRGVLFYDGGAGWNTPDAACITSAGFRNNAFNYRHAIGFGIRLTSPTPMRIDWGFKLDRNKRLHEQVSEMHFTMSHDF